MLAQPSARFKNLDIIDEIKTQIFFGKSTNVYVIPTIYNENTPLHNNINNEYFILLHNSGLDTYNYKEFMSNFISSTTVLNERDSMSLFMVDTNGILNFVDYWYDSDVTTSSLIGSGFSNINNENLIVNLNGGVDGIYLSSSDYTSDISFKDIFTVKFKDSTTYNGFINSLYAFPIDSTNVSDLEYVRNDFQLTSSTNSYPMEIGYRPDTSSDLTSIESYFGVHINGIISNELNEQEIGLIYKNIERNSCTIDFYKNGVLDRKLFNNISSIVWEDSTNFQIIEDGLLIDCELDWTSQEFVNRVVNYDFEEHRELFKTYDEVFKIGKNFISTKYEYNTTETNINDIKYYINNVEFLETPFPEKGSSVWGTNYTIFYNSERSNRNRQPLSPLYYQFVNWTIFPRYGFVLPNEIFWSDKEIFQWEHDSTDSYYYTYNKGSDTLVEIDSTVNVVNGDYSLISTIGNKNIYNINSFIKVDASTEFSINVMDNVNDSDGAFKDIFDKTDSKLTFKIEPYEYDIFKDSTIFNTSLKMHVDDMNILLHDHEKFIKLTNANNKYYIKQCGYKFDSISDIKNNLYDILEANFYNDKIDTTSIDFGNYNYIDGVVAIQKDISDDLVAYNLKNRMIDVGNKRIKTNKIWKSQPDVTTNSHSFEITEYFDSTNNSYDITSVPNAAFYNIDEEMGQYFHLVFELETEWLKNSKYNALLQSAYEIVDFTSAEDSYDIFDSTTPIDSTNFTYEDTTNLDTTTLSDSIHVSSLGDFTIYNNITNIENFDITDTEMLIFKVEVADNTSLNNFHNEDLFNNINFYDNIALTFNIGDQSKNVNIDVLSKSCEINDIYIDTNEKILNFGNFTKKFPLWYSYKLRKFETTDTTNFQLYNVGEMKSENFFTPNTQYIASTGIWNDVTNSIEMSGSFSDNVNLDDHNSHTIFSTYNLEWWDSGQDGEEHRLFERNYGYSCGFFVDATDSTIIYNGVNVDNFQGATPVADHINVWGYKLNDVHQMADKTVFYNTSYVISKDTDFTHSFEKLWFDGTAIDATIEINERKYYNNISIPFYDNEGDVEWGQVNTYNNMKNFLWFNFELNDTEMSYFNDNIDSIYDIILAEKNKCGTITTTGTNTFVGFSSQNYSKFGQLYDVNRSFEIIAFKYDLKLYIFVNGKLVDIHENILGQISIDKIKMYSNKQYGDKIITILKKQNCILNFSGVWY